MLGRKKASVTIASIIPHIIKLNSDWGSFCPAFPFTFQKK